MINCEYKLPVGDLASRSRAIGERKKIEEFLQKNEHLLVNCDDVLSISESYADEIFGVLVVQYGFDFLLENLTIVNAKKHVLQSIASVIDRRNQESSNKAQMN
tara:strand:+ start:235 stop:543 length:309 start_codon:yes stop_codon:yes gene_type:complete